MTETVIHPTAIVSAGAELGAGVEVGAYSVIGPRVRLGDLTKVGPHAVIDGRTTLGRECSVSPFASIGGPPQDLKYRGESSTLTLGERNTVREYVTLQPGTATGRMATIIGSDNLFMASSHVAHDCIVGDNNVFANSATLAGHVTIASNVILGGLVAIHQFAYVGDYAFLGGGSMVSQDVPPYAMAQGDRCHIVGINLVGLRRAGFTPDDIRAVKTAYHQLFYGAGNPKNRVRDLAPEVVAVPAVQRLILFVTEQSKRGSIRPRRGSASEASEDA